MIIVAPEMLDDKPVDSIAVVEDASVGSPDAASVPEEHPFPSHGDDGTKKTLFEGFPTLDSAESEGSVTESNECTMEDQDPTPSDAAANASIFNLFALGRLSQIVWDLFSKETMKTEDTGVAKNLIAALFGTLSLVAYCLINGEDDALESPIGSKIHPTFVTSIILIVITSLLTDGSTRGECLLIFVACSVIFFVSTTAMLSFTSPCAHCALSFTSSDVDESSIFAILEPSDHEWTFWHVLLGEDVDIKEDRKTIACRNCISNFVVVLYGGLYEYLMKRIGVDTTSKVPREIQELPEELPEELDLATWYVQYANKARQQDWNLFIAKVADALEENGHLQGEELSDALLGYLCSPASRFDNPDPVKFLTNLKTPRFTGETGLANLTKASLQRIMRGDVLKELGVAVCFMLRFALAVPEDHQLETTPIKHTTILPSLNEDEMKSFDIRAELVSDIHSSRRGNERLKCCRLTGLPFSSFLFSLVL
jgi:hypothetical protein